MFRFVYCLNIYVRTHISLKTAQWVNKAGLNVQIMWPKSRIEKAQIQNREGAKKKLTVTNIRVGSESRNVLVKRFFPQV